MRHIRDFFKAKQVKIGLAAVCTAAVLTAAFILQPGPKKTAVSIQTTPTEADIAFATEFSGVEADSFGKTTPADIQTPSGTVSTDAENAGINTTDASDSQRPVGATASVKNGGGENTDAPSSTDKYLTDPTPPGKPNPVEPQDVTIDPGKTHTCTLSIRCDSILNNMEMFNTDKLSVLPPDGVIMPSKTVTFYENESVFDVLKRETKAAHIQMEFEWTPIYNSVYIEGIHNLYEFDCGELSGWMYKVNDWFPNYGASRYVLKQGDKIEWVYTCDLGRDVGCEWLSNTPSQ